MTAPELQQPIELKPLFRERVWGRETLLPYFTLKPSGERIGEVWFTFEENETALGVSLGKLLSEHPETLGTAGNEKRPGICPLLVKLLLTTERLSVQVHPGDEYAEKHHNSLGKTEAWYVLDAQPPGEIALGFERQLESQEFRAAAQSGEIEHLLRWKQVKPGEIIFVPAGMVHAVGAGLVICEIQENSDITYRLYDYGRPRELHLEHGARVATLAPHRAETKTVKRAEGRDELLACEYFRIERLRPERPLQIPGSLPYYGVLICVKGQGTMHGRECRAGQAWFLPANGEPVTITGSDSEWIFTYTAQAPAR